MRGSKLLICAVCALIAVVAAITAIVVFRKQIVEFLVDVKEKIDINKLRHNGEYADYADV